MAKLLIGFFAFTTLVCGVKWYTAGSECADTQKKLEEATAKAKAVRLGVQDVAGVEITSDPLEEGERAAYVLQAIELGQLREENDRSTKLLERAENAKERAEKGRVEALRKLEASLREGVALAAERDELKNQYIQLAKEVLRYKQAHEHR